jgi:hypothetical protein
MENQGCKKMFSDIFQSIQMVVAKYFLQQQLLPQETSQQLAQQ